MDVVIVGASVAGLTAAIALIKKGYNVRVFEQSSLTEKTGLGVGLQGFAVEVLSNLGLSDLVSQGVPIKRTSFYTRNGHLLYKGSLNTQTDYNKLGVRRSDLLFSLLNTIRCLNKKNNVYPYHKLVSFEQDSNRVEATFFKKIDASLIKIKADLLIAADGLHSKARSILFPHTNEIKFSGIVTWRGLTHFHDFLDNEMLLMGDKSAKTVIYPVKVLPNKQIEYYWAAEVLQENNTSSFMPQDKKGKLEEFVIQFDNFRFKGIKIPDLYQKAQKILKFPIVDKDPISRWFINRVVLIGDAAHPMYPMGGNGASQAIIDAVSLADALSEASSLQYGLDIFCIKRVNKVNEIVMSNRELGPDKVLTSDKPEFGSDNHQHYHEIIEEYKILTNPSSD